MKRLHSDYFCLVIYLLLGYMIKLLSLVTNSHFSLNSCELHKGKFLNLCELG